MPRLQMRYQYLSKDGIAWTPWFNTTVDTKRTYQYTSGKLKLKNEYRTINK